MASNGEFPAPDGWLDHRVSYGETDGMGWTYYGEYLHYFERGRGELIRSTGMSYAEVEARGLLLPVRQASVRYRAPARYDELIRIRTAISEWGRASITFVYQIWNEDRSTLLAEGSTQHACIDAKERRPVPTPAWLKALFVSP